MKQPQPEDKVADDSESKEDSTRSQRGRIRRMSCWRQTETSDRKCSSAESENKTRVERHGHTEAYTAEKQQRNGMTDIATMNITTCGYTSRQRYMHRFIDTLRQLNMFTAMQLYAYTPIRPYTSTPVHLYPCTHELRNRCTYACIQICLYTFVHMDECTYMHMRACKYMNIYTYTQLYATIYVLRRNRLRPPGGGASARDSLGHTICVAFDIETVNVWSFVGMQACTNSDLRVGQGKMCP